MRRGAAHLTLVLGDPDKAGRLRAALEDHGVDHAAVVAHVNSIRRSLVLGENDFVVVCIALDEATIRRHGDALRGLLSDNRCFPTPVRTVGLISELGLTREVAELGCDVYVDDSARAAEVVRLLDDTWEAEAPAVAAGAVSEPGRGNWMIRGGWTYGSPKLPDELTSLVPVDPAARDDADTPCRTERSDAEFGDRLGPH